ncbi:MAG: hypothetical protein JO358_06465 [Alphaproteobacteria bacterium]|nr:hypothetical protein [Alphaproteobacteria bacterium]
MQYREDAVPELPPILTADSITRVGTEAGDAVVVNGSHGGVYAAYLAAKLRVRAAIFNDAGVGRDRAGVAGLEYLADLGIPAAAVGHDSARIGDGADMMARGRITHANGLAQALGCRPGMACREAAVRLQRSRSGNREPPTEREGSFLLLADPPAVWALDSASLVDPEHIGTIVVTGSHGGLLGDRPDTALKCDALAALFNDAGIGIDAAGVSRLPALDRRGIAAGTVAAASARIGDARSTFEDGVLSRVNARAAALGIAPGMTARDFVAIARRAAAEWGKLA